MHLIDLTMPIDMSTPVFPDDPKPEFRQLRTIAKEGANVACISFSQHFGTHVDAPYHMLAHGKRLDDFPVSKFAGDAIVLDVRGQREIDHDLEGVHAGDIVLFCTGHTRKAHDPAFFTGNPVLTPALARRLVEKEVSIVGIDSFTPDDAPYEVHKILLGADILIVENLVGLEQLVGRRVTCWLLPLKLSGADGAPCRAVAALKEE